MKLAFWITTNKYFDPAKLDDTPFGGCEIEAFNVGKALAKAYGEKVLVFANVSERHNSESFLFFQYGDLVDALERNNVDAFVVVRADDRILSPRRSALYLTQIKPQRVILWSGDSYDQPNNELMHDTMTLNRIDKIILKGQWQKEAWLKAFSYINAGKVAVIRKGLNTEWLSTERSQAIAPKFVYASTAFRGLSKFHEIWPMIKTSIPQATLDCYCKVSLYADNKLNLEYEKLYESIGKLDGVTIKEPLPQKDFLKELPQYYAMLYPNTFEETVCGVALEAMASGVPIITTKSAGLIETVRDGGGILIDENPHSKEYDRKFVDQVIALWNNGGLREDLSMRGFNNIRDKYAIAKISHDWQNVLGELFS